MTTTSYALDLADQLAHPYDAFDFGYANAGEGQGCSLTVAVSGLLRSVGREESAIKVEQGHAEACASGGHLTDDETCPFAHHNARLGRK